MEKNSCLKIIAVFVMVLLAGVLFSFHAYAYEQIKFTSDYQITDGANNYFIAKDRSGHYGLLNSKGETEIDFDENYSMMEFVDLETEDSTYHFVKVKQGENWGVLDYKGKEIIPAQYRELDAYSNDNTIAAGYDGNKTWLYDQKGKQQKNKLSGDFSDVISEHVFNNSKALRNERDNELLDLEQKHLLKVDDADSNNTVSVIKDVGGMIVTQYYCESPGETFGNLKVDRYIKIYNDKGDFIQDVTPDEEWAKDEDSQINGSLGLKKAISDNSFLVKMKMPEGKESFLLICTLQDGGSRYSQKFKKVSEFTDGRAFALNMDDDLFLINTQGEKISDSNIDKDGYERLVGFGKEPELLKVAYIRFKKDDNIKLYSLVKDKELEESYKEVTFKNNGYVILKNDDGKYGVMDNQGNMAIPFGDFSKEELDNEDRAFYSENCITLVKASGESYDVNAYSLADQEKESFFKEHLIPILIGAGVFLVLLIVIIVLLVLRSKKRKQREIEKQRELLEEQRRKKLERERQNRIINRQYTDNSIKKQVQKSVVAQPVNISLPSGYMKCLRGEYAGSVFRIKSGESIRIGRSHDGNDLIINNPKVSRRHCSVRFDGTVGEYHFTDYSTNGVYLSGGKRLPSNQDVTLREGTILCIGNEDNVFELGGNRS